MLDEEKTENPTWFIDDGVPGVGDRPEWLNEKFKTAAELGKSYAELEKRFGTVPEDYAVKSKFINPEYQPIHEFFELAKEKRVSKDVIDKMVDSIDRYIGEYTVDPAEEMKKLGDNAQDRMKTLDNWAKANLSQSSYEALTDNLKTADAIKGLEELRNKMMSGNTMVPSGNDAAVNNTQTLDDIKAEITNNLDKYKTDPKYRDSIRARLEVAAKNSNFVDKVGA